MGSRVWFGIVVSALVAAACASSGDDAATARHRCEQLRDHLIDVRMAQIGPQSMVPTIATPDSSSGPGLAKSVAVPRASNVAIRELKFA